METKKKTWTRPQLVVLERGRPEESVLAACRYDVAQVIGPGGNKCKAETGSGNCNSLVDS